MMQLSEAEARAHHLANRCMVAEIRLDGVLELLRAHRVLFSEQQMIQEAARVRFLEAGSHALAVGSEALARDLRVQIRKIDQAIAEATGVMEPNPESVSR